MIIINLKGGMGNQMFQYAAGYALAKKLGCELKIDDRYLLDRELNPTRGYTVRTYDLDVFGVEKNKATQDDLMHFGLQKGGWKRRAIKTLILSFFSKKHQYETKFCADIKIPPKKTAYIDGYWQSEKYFSEFEADIRRIYQIDSSPNPKVCDLVKSLTNDAVCVNVRRTDFVGSAHHDVVGLDFYSKAAKRLRLEFGENLKFYVFSDEPDWCESNLKFLKTVEVIDHSFAGNKFRDYFYLMTRFNKFIIPNSTFAWWAAWLSADKNKTVIAPKIWSNNRSESESRILPNSWIGL